MFVNPLCPYCGAEFASAADVMKHLNKRQCRKINLPINPEKQEPEHPDKVEGCKTEDPLAAANEKAG